MFKVNIYVSLKPGVADPQGATIKHALDSLGYEGVGEVRTGKYFRIELDVSSKQEAKQKTKDMCQKILVNPVIENFKYRIEEVK